MGRDLPKGDSPEAAIPWRGSFLALKTRQLSGERDVRSGSRSADRACLSEPSPASSAARNE
jgi:hypothetical protein